MEINIFWLVAGLLILNSLETQALSEDGNPFKHKEILDKEGRYVLEWLADLQNSRIFFNLTVKTKGYVALGLSQHGKMTGADIVIGGVLPNGRPYLLDTHATGHETPILDPNQDWQLHQAWERDSVTFLSFSRKLETCDKDNDLPIEQEGDVIALLWAFGETDDDKIEYHQKNRGVFWVYLLDADLSPNELHTTNTIAGDKFGDWDIWRMMDTYLIPEKHTTYLCSIHKMPGNTKMHIVGLRTILFSEIDTQHVHHYILHRCIPPSGQSAQQVFENVIGLKEECYELEYPIGKIPTQYCTELVHGWAVAVGGRPLFFPEHAGIPMYPGEYFMLQVHYGNAHTVPDLWVNHALEVFYTDKLRKHDAGILAVGNLQPGPVSLLIPPNSLNHEIYGHCAPGCLSSMMPQSGIHIFASLLHTHTGGRHVQLHHFRNNRELPWVTYDNNFNFNYQQLRTLSRERTILPGDSLYFRCHYQNMDPTGSVKLGGFSTSQEMCSTFLWYYPRMPGPGYCRSDVRIPEYLQFLQIYNTTWSNEHLEEIVISPKQNAGLMVSQAAKLIDWGIPENRKRLQDFHKYAPQVNGCPWNYPDQPGYAFESRYPTNVVPYEKQTSCGASFQRRNKK